MTESTDTRAAAPAEETTPLLAWSREEITDDFSAAPPPPVRSIWPPMALLVAVLMAAAVLCTALLASGYMRRPVADPGPSSPTVTRPVPTLPPLPPVGPPVQSAPAPTLQASPPTPPSPPSPPPTSTPPSDGVTTVPFGPHFTIADRQFLNALSGMDWPLDQLNSAALTVQGRSVCAILAGPPALDDVQAALVVANRYGASSFRAGEFVEAAHSAYCPAGVAIA